MAYCADWQNVWNFSGYIFVFSPWFLFFLPLALFPFLTPVFDALNVSLFPRDVISFFTTSVERMKENRMKEKEKVITDCMRANVFPILFI